MLFTILPSVKFRVWVTEMPIASENHYQLEVLDIFKMLQSSVPGYVSRYVLLELV